MAECVRLESGYTERYREFESLPLRSGYNQSVAESPPWRGWKADIPKGVDPAKRGNPCPVVMRSIYCRGLPLRFGKIK